jgi:hypothetical protein
MIAYMQPPAFAPCILSSQNMFVIHHIQVSAADEREGTRNIEGGEENNFSRKLIFCHVI